MFDVRPVDKTGAVDFAKISFVSPVIKLRNKNNKAPIKINRTKIENENVVIAIAPIASPQIVSKETVPHISEKEELENFLSSEFNPHIEIASVGGEIISKNDSKPRYKPILRNNFQNEDEATPIFASAEVALGDDPFDKIQGHLEQRRMDDYQPILAEMRRPIKLAGDGVIAGELKEISIFNTTNLEKANPIQSSPELNFWTEQFKPKERSPKFGIKLSALSSTGILAVLAISLGAFYFGQYGFNVKNELAQEGGAAAKSIETAKENLKNFDFVSASDNFARAYEEFSKAGERLNFMGASISSFIAEFPGAGKLKSAKNIIAAGKLIANSGKAMSDAIGAVAKTGLILNPSESGGMSISKIMGSLGESLSLSKKNIKKARALLADIEIDDIPEDKKPAIEELNAKLPLFEKLISEATDYSKFLENLIGTKGAKKYLLLFQNSNELRPTGGFPGSYGVISFKDGQLQDFFADDSYNLDGQLKDLIIPPLQLQHITPAWGMRDANWFVDFPSSAAKISQFFKKEAGYDIDGVITVNPKIVSKILDIVGSVEMPQYGVVLNSENLITTVQDQVEYKGDRKKPKQIVMDLAPELLKKLYLADSGKWMNIFNILVASLESKDILMYFRDLGLESFSADKGFSGAVKQTSADYLMVTLANVKGSKTDAMIDSSVKIDTAIESRSIKHELSLVRQHNGGETEYGFYNKINPAFVRVLVPEGSELISITGNSKPNYKPLINYDKSFKTDDDLFKFESSAYYDSENEVFIFKESGKTEFGFWMITEPGETKTIIVEYAVPLKIQNGKYELLVQKQPGFEIKNFEFVMNKPDNLEITSSEPTLNKIGDKYILNGALERDTSIGVLFK